ncbi:universal stress protein [Nannocystis pusilla]|uniref:Universal stress protein n=1 Tax=Nannocystis pusilla TaxID=889268 RepID=A0ABS7U617_9BACT|nr:universal stress protein [Nannocystis pusilla]MBZ5715696.1 universal stress protein [Nannocystis pusilla]
MAGYQKWIVGVDLRERSDGAARLGAWLHRQSPDAMQLVGIHAIEEGALDEHIQFAERVRTRERLRVAVERALEQAGVRAAFAGIEVVEADDPVMALEAAMQAEAARGIIIGRRAAGAGTQRIRLGSVARRLLRRLPAPTFVVPPDWDVEGLGDGPIVVAVTLAEASVGAVKVAQSLGTMTRRPLEFIRVIPTSPIYAALSPPREGRLERETRQLSEVAALTHAWLAEQKASGHLVVRRGDEVAEILALATERSAPLLVCGSRLLSLAERAFGFSLSSDLAAHAPIPVLVVPSDTGA